jgi:hypothetical protein
MLQPLRPLGNGYDLGAYEHASIVPVVTSSGGSSSSSNSGGSVFGGPLGIGYVATPGATSTINVTPPGTSGSHLSETQIQSIIALVISFGADTSTVANITASLRGIPMPAGSHASSTSSFTRDLQSGMKGDDVKMLQQYLKRTRIYP